MPVPVPPNAMQVYNGIMFDVWRWEQELFDGSRAPHECITRPDTSTVVAFLDTDTIILTRQEHSGGRVFIDVPGGRMEMGESAIETARREFLEETGYRAGIMDLFHKNDQYGSARYSRYLFLARDLTLNPSGSNPDAGERIKVVPTTWADAVRMALRRELRSTEAMLAILAMEFDPEARAVKERFLKG